LHKANNNKSRDHVYLFVFLYFKEEGIVSQSIQAGNQHTF